MYNKLSILSIAAVLFLGCNQPESAEANREENATSKTEIVDVKDKNFDELFVKIDPKDMNVNFFEMLDRDWSVVTAGGESDYNSMVASWGAFGIFFGKPAAWLILNANRYTLEKIKTYEKFTLSYLDTIYKEQKLLFGSKSGRDSDKMKESTLTPVITPSGNTAYKEAYMIIESDLGGITEFSPGDFKHEDHKKFIVEGKEKGNGKEYHKLLTGFISDVWIRK